MKAIQITDDKAVWNDVPDLPPPRADHVHVQVHATAVNRADLVQRAGRYNPPPGASQILGLEFAGTVSSVGDGVSESRVGDRVFTITSGGSYAETVEVPEAHLMSIPADMSFTDAAAIAEVFITAYLNLRIEGGLIDGEIAMIHAGSSGVGTAALQLLRLWGNDSFATTSTPKVDRLRSMFPETKVIDRLTESFQEIVDKSGGVDVILDPVGADYLNDNLKSLKVCGRLVNIGLMGGRDGALPMGLVLVRRLRVIGSVLRARSIAEKVDIIAAFSNEVLPHFGTELSPVIDSIVPIEQTQDAHDRVGANLTFGKVILTVLN